MIESKYQDTTQEGLTGQRQEVPHLATFHSASTIRLHKKSILELLNKLVVERYDRVRRKLLSPKQFARDVIREGKRYGFSLSHIGYCMIAEAYAGANDYVNAERYYRRALRENRDYVLAMNNLGVTFIEAKRFQDALVLLRRALELDPNDVRVMTNMGIALAELGNFQEYVRLMEQASDLDPSNVSSLMNLGIRYALRQDFESASTVFRRVISRLEKSPGDARDTLADAHLLLGESLLAMKLPAALTAFRTAVDILPDAIRLTHLAEALIDLEKWEDAAQTLTEAEDQLNTPKDFDPQLFKHLVERLEVIKRKIHESNRAGVLPKAGLGRRILDDEGAKSQLGDIVERMMANPLPKDAPRFSRDQLNERG